MTLYRPIKRGFDIAGSVAALAVSAPLCAAVSLLIKQEGPGPVIFVHNRVGVGGKKIRVYKFRSMHIGSEELITMLSGEQIERFYLEYKLNDDPRVTAIGRVIRRSFIDEIPQFINIIQGDMTLVGPRPITKPELSFYSEEERKRLLSVKPGLTGLWQVFGKGKANYQNRKRQKMELYYVEHASFALDLIILIMTPLALFRK